MEADPNPLPKFDILPHPLRRLGRALCDLFSMHQLASHGDHFVHPLDDALDTTAYETLGETADGITPSQ